MIGFSFNLIGKISDFEKKLEIFQQFVIKFIKII